MMAALASWKVRTDYDDDDDWIGITFKVSFQPTTAPPSGCALGQGPPIERGKIGANDFIWGVFESRLLALVGVELESEIGKMVIQFIRLVILCCYCAERTMDCRNNDHPAES